MLTDYRQTLPSYGVAINNCSGVELHIILNVQCLCLSLETDTCIAYLVSGLAWQAGGGKQTGVGRQESSKMGREAIRQMYVRDMRLGKESWHCHIW